jgi:cytochrome c-type biogenesis protein CcmH/NrfF
MNRRSVFLAPLSVLATAPLAADPANGDPRLEKLFAMFVAPCCWRENLITHHSPTADEMRAEIRQRIAAGATDEEIKSAYLEKYSMRILAVPDGGRGSLLTWTPVVVAAAGLGVVTMLVRRMATAAPRPDMAGEVMDLPDVEWEWDTPAPGTKRGERE